MASAQTLPTGPIEQVSTSGLPDPGQARVSADAAGHYTVAWTRDSDGEIVFRRFDAQGSALDLVERVAVTDPFQVFSLFELEVEPAGGHVLAWRRSFGGQSLRAQRLAADGSLAGAEILVDDGTQGRPERFDIATRSDGGFAIVYRRTFSGHGTYLSRWDGANALVESYTLATAGSTGDSFQEPVAVFAPQDRLLAAWDERRSGVPPRVLQLADVDLGTSTFTISTPEAIPLDNQAQPLLVPLQEGGFVLLWNELNRFNNPQPEWCRLHAQRLDDQGQALGPVTQIGTFFATSAAALPGGGFTVAGNEAPAENVRDDVVVRTFDSVLRPTSDLTLAAAGLADADVDARVAPTGAGFVVVWVDPALEEVFSRAFLPVPVSSPEIEVLTPTAGDRYLREAFYDVTWTAATVPGRLDVELSRDGGFTWETLRASTANDGEWSWRVRGPSTSSARIRITSLDDPSISGLSSGLFAIPEPQIAVLTPNGGESWPIGEQQDITWTLTDMAGPVVVELSRDNGATWVPFWYMTPNDGLWRWRPTAPPGAGNLVRVSSYWDPTVFDISDGDFSIPAPQITALSPNGGETLTVGTQATIEWAMGEIGGPVGIELSRDGGQTWELVRHDTPNDGSWQWQVTGPATANAILRVHAVVDEQYADSSDLAFTIADP